MHRIIVCIGATALSLVRLPAALGIEDAAAAKTSDSSPAHVEHPVQETELTLVRITEQARTRLGIQTVPVEIRRVQRQRVYPGEILVPPGSAVSVSAPVAGFLTVAPSQPLAPRPGLRVERGAPVLMLVPGMAENGQVFAATDRISMAKIRSDLLSAIAEIDGQIKEAEIRIEVAAKNLDRAETLAKEEAASKRAYDEALAAHELALAAKSAAVERREALVRVQGDLATGDQAAIPMTSPLSGLIRSVHVVPNEFVPAGAALFEVVALDMLWVRVPIYVGDVERLDTEAPAHVGGLADRKGADLIPANRVFPPGTADPIASTVDLYYELADAEHRFRPGQRVGVTLSTSESDSGPAVPSSALLVDIHGGVWVYECTEPGVYRRVRVSVRDVVDGVALLDHGPAVGAMIVTDGAAELFGTEFGAGK